MENLATNRCPAYLTTKKEDKKTPYNPLFVDIIKHFWKVSYCKVKHALLSIIIYQYINIRCVRMVSWTLILHIFSQISQHHAHPVSPSRWRNAALQVSALWEGTSFHGLKTNRQIFRHLCLSFFPPSLLFYTWAIAEGWGFPHTVGAQERLEAVL